MSTTLNEVQQQIVKSTEGPVMVLAGAGSGKTRVLTHRIGYIIEHGLANPQEILAITFTNKAANEIKNRLFSMNIDASYMWAMTFHSMCCRILRIEAGHLDGYTSNFSIFDEQDKRSVIKKILKDVGSKNDDDVSEVSNRLSKFKMSNLTLDEYANICCFSEYEKFVFDVMKKYQEQLKKENAMDFDDLINNALFLLKSNSYVREKYQRQFRYILVDEFQDTNETQYELVKILGGYHKNVFAVGDEDQSIYGWRGASVNNIKRFLNDFAGTKLFKLEQNYRSTKNIIENANKIIKNNTDRIDKTLFTENDAGANVAYKKCFNDREEADYITKTILDLVHIHGYEFKDIAVLMRMNALSRNFEEKFVAYDIPYKIFGGFKFYERAEIKNVLAYLKLLVNPFDDESFLRVINFPKRGIGDGSVQKLRAVALGKSLFQTAMSLSDAETGTMAKFLPFKHLMQDLMTQMDNMSLFDFAKYVIDKTRVLDEYGEDTEDDINKKMNISELLQNVQNYASENPDKTLVDFLQTISLSTDIDEFEEQNNTVTLATVHSVKGLEFKVVFVVGLEEKFFPIIRFNSEEDDMEEERRLMYVAITRAMERLYLTCARSRFMYGKKTDTKVSRFVKELGFEMPTKTYDFDDYDSYDEYERPAPVQSAPKNQFDGSISSFMHTAKNCNVSGYMVGDRVFHSKFGVGFITKIEGDTATIDFDGFGNKMLSLKFAPIKKL